MIAIILNVTLLYRPAFNLPRSSIKTYLNDWDGRGWAFLAGFLCGFGNGLQFMGGQAAGYAAADAVQALPLVSTFWGVLFFGEYFKSSRRTYVPASRWIYREPASRWKAYTPIEKKWKLQHMRHVKVYPILPRNLREVGPIANPKERVFFDPLQ
ncbi:putative ureide permease [Helianthus debilis subsp. tardiflorus]